MPRAKYWTDEEVAALTHMVAAGANDAECAIGLGRSRQAVLLKRNQIGLGLPREEVIRRKVQSNAMGRAPMLATVLAAYDAGGTVAAIARMMQIDHRTVANWLRASGRDTRRGLAWAKEGKPAADLSAIEVPEEDARQQRVTVDAVKAAPDDLSGFYRGRRYDADDMRLRPAPTLRGLPPTHVPTQSVLMGA